MCEDSGVTAGCVGSRGVMIVYAGVVVLLSQCPW